MVVSETGKPMLVHVYRTTNTGRPYKPTKKYQKFILDGAKALGLPEECIESITTETID
jgi:hypothetical protein